MNGTVTAVDKDGKQYFLGRVGDESWKVRAMLERVRHEVAIDVLPTIYGDPYVVFHGTLDAFRKARQLLSGVWMEVLGTRKLFLEHGEVFCEDAVYFLSEDEVREMVSPIFQVCLKDAEYIEF